MNATVQNMLKQYETQVKVETLREVSAQLADMASKYDNLLDNEVAHEIFLQVQGMKMERLSRIRGYLRSKCEMIWMLSGQMIREANRLDKMRMK